jgi:hypothetical protein
LAIGQSSSVCKTVLWQTPRDDVNTIFSGNRKKLLNSGTLPAAGGNQGSAEFEARRRRLNASDDGILDIANELARGTKKAARSVEE